MSEKTPARPRQVSWATAFVVSGSLFLLVTVFETLGQLPSVQLREQVAEAISGSGLSLGTGQVLGVMRWALYVTAVAAAVSFVGGIFAFQRHRGARIAVSVAAVPILLTSPVTGVFLGVLVAMGTTSLWSGQARDWFAGRPIRELPTRQSRSRRDAAATPPATPASTPPASPSGAQPTAPTATTPTGAPLGSQTSVVPPPTQGYGDPHRHPTQAAPYADPTQPGGPWSTTPTDRAPAPVRIACALTWGGSLMVLIAMLGTLVTWLVAPDVLRPQLVDATQSEGLRLPDDLVGLVVWTMVLMFGGWAAGAAVLALLVRRRHDWARWLLIVSAAVAGVLALFSFPVGLPIAAFCVISVALLLRPESRAWFAARDHGYPHPPHQPPHQPPYPPQR